MSRAIVAGQPAEQPVFPINRQAVALLTKARDHYARAIEALNERYLICRPEQRAP